MGVNLPQMQFAMSSIGLCALLLSSQPFGIAGNQVGIQGTTSLAEMLAINTTLKRLNVDCMCPTQAFC